MISEVVICDTKDTNAKCLGVPREAAGRGFVLLIQKIQNYAQVAWACLGWVGWACGYL